MSKIDRVTDIVKKNNKTNNSKNEKKGEAARRMILEAASKVFSRHSYRAASIRMVGKEGGFEHQLITYYFPTKASLFEAVVQELYQSFFDNEYTFYKGHETASLREVLNNYLDRFFDFHDKHPEILRIIMQNTSYIENIDDIPAYQHYPEFYSRFMTTFKEIIPPGLSVQNISRILYSFSILICNYLGASPTYAPIVKMEPDSLEYRQWVKETLIQIFHPILKKAFFPGSNPNK